MVLSDQGVKIPEDFEMITSDDSQVPRYTRPNLQQLVNPSMTWGLLVCAC